MAIMQSRILIFDNHAHLDILAVLENSKTVAELEL